MSVHRTRHHGLSAVSDNGAADEAVDLIRPHAGHMQCRRQHFAAATIFVLSSHHCALQAACTLLLPCSQVTASHTRVIRDCRLTSLTSPADPMGPGDARGVLEASSSPHCSHVSARPSLKELCWRHKSEPLYIALGTAQTAQALRHHFHRPTKLAMPAAAARLPTSTNSAHLALAAL